MLPLLTAALSLLQQKQQQAEADKQRKMQADMGESLSRPPQQQQGGLGALGNVLGNLKGQPHAKADLASKLQSNGTQGDPLSYDSVKALNGIGVDGSATSDEDLLGAY